MTSRKKEVERLQTSELARSNIQRPFIQFDMKRPQRQACAGVEGIRKSYGDRSVVIDNFHGSGDARREGLPHGPQRRGQDDDAAVAARRMLPGERTRISRIDAGTVKWGHEVADRLLSAGSRGSDPARDDGVDWLHQLDPQA